MGISQERIGRSFDSVSNTHNTPPDEGDFTESDPDPAPVGIEPERIR